jgi:hypothetical protein
MDYDPIPAEDEELAHEIIGAAIEVHRVLGPGFLESISKTTRLGLGLLINFRVLVLKDGIERVVR